MIIDVVNRSNQRGGRMLSVIDLIEAGTLSTPQTAWLLARIGEGSSWMVGAKPGGAGKTTVMSALLAMLPEETTVYITNRGSGWESASPGECVVCYEISPGAYDGYIWGGDVARLAALSKEGVRIVANLHADTLREAYSQIVEQCGASPAHFNRLRLFLPIHFGRGSREISCVKYFNGRDWRNMGREEIPMSGHEENISGFLSELNVSGIRKVEEVRAEWLAYLSGGIPDSSAPSADKNRPDNG